jgi:ElaB/YqjD/DUF883 family membrane-anchored ribosome-binding protein
MAERPHDWTAGDPNAHRADDPATPDPETIRAEIRETRDRLGHTLEELGERLNPQHIGQRVKHDIRDATIGRVEHMARQAVDRVQETRNSLADTIRENPIPSAMIGIGLGWLFMNRRRSAPSNVYGPYVAYPPRRVDAYDTGAYGGSGYGTSGTYDSRYAAGGAYAAYDADEPGAAERVRERASELGHEASERVREFGHEAGERAREFGQEASERARELADRTRSQARRAEARVEDRFREQPLVVGAATLALGLAAGFALPATEREVALMGDARDKLVDRVKDVASETGEKVQHVASRVIDEAQHTAKEAARDEGLAGGGRRDDQAQQPQSPGQPQGQGYGQSFGQTYGSGPERRP